MNTVFQTHCYKVHVKETKSGRRHLSVKEKVKLLVRIKHSLLLTISVFHYFTSNSVNGRLFKSIFNNRQ